MKKFLLATTFATFGATSAFAGPSYFGVSGEAAYSVENEAVALEIGPDLAFGDFAFEPRLYGSADTDGLAFEGVSVEASYGLSNAVSVFGTVYADEDMSYEDAHVGVRFEF
jgi:hypothetical protein